MSNKLNITKCDNELILIAYQNGASFQLGRILSGNSNSLDITLEINPGAYQGGAFVNGVNHVIEPSTHFLNLAQGDYQLVAVGIDWGGPSEFNFTFNGNEYSTPLNNFGNGIVWKTDPIKFSI
jgi:hypothetical protein